MKISEAIVAVDELKPNVFSENEKERWLRELEGKIYQEIVMTHEGADEVILDDEELIAQSPYDDMYIKWLEAKIDYYNREMDQYNNSISMFYSGYVDFRNYWNRTHLPKCQRLKL